MAWPDDDYTPQVGDRVRYVPGDRSEPVTGVVTERVGCEEHVVVMKLDRRPTWWEYADEKLDAFAAPRQGVEPLLPPTRRQRRLDNIVRVAFGGRDPSDV